MERLEVQPASGRSQCPYCHAGFTSSERIWECPRCKTSIHDECARQHGGCTVLGCGALVGDVPGAAPRTESAHRVVGVARGARQHAPVETDRALWWVLVAIGVVALAMTGLLFGVVKLISSRHDPLPPVVQPSLPPGSLVPGEELFDSTVQELLGEVEKREVWTRTTGGKVELDFGRGRELSAARSLIEAQLESNGDRQALEGRLREALRLRAGRSDPRLVEAVLRDTFSLEPRDAAALARKHGGTTTWGTTPPGTAFTVETTEGHSVSLATTTLVSCTDAAARLSTTASNGAATTVEAPLEVNHLDSWSAIYPKGEVSLETRAGTFKCLRFEGVAILDGRPALMEVWVAPNLPVAVKSVVKVGSTTTTRVLASIARP